MANKKGQNNSQMKRRGGPERRAVPRIKREVLLQYRIKEAPSIKGVQIPLKPYVDITRTKDLSEKGVFFTASRAISPKTILDINLQLPIQRKFIGLEGRVAGCEEITKNLIYGIGVEFINLKDEQKKTLQDFVQFFLKDKGRKKWKE